MHEQHARTLGREVFVAPGLHGHDDRLEIVATLGQNIFMARRAFAIAAFFQDAGLDQRAEAPRQHVGRDAQAFLELVEARQPMQGVSNDQDAPPFAYPLQAAGDGALHLAEAFSSHGSIVVL